MIPPNDKPNLPSYLITGESPPLTVNAYLAKHRIRLNRRDRTRLRAHLSKRVAQGYARRYGTKRQYTYREPDISGSYYHMLTHERPHRHSSPQPSGCCTLALLAAAAALLSGIICAIVNL